MRFRSFLSRPSARKIPYLLGTELGSISFDLSSILRTYTNMTQLWRILSRESSLLGQRLPTNRSALPSIPPLNPNIDLQAPSLGRSGLSLQEGEYLSNENSLRESPIIVGWHLGSDMWGSEWEDGFGHGVEFGRILVSFFFMEHPLANWLLSSPSPRDLFSSEGGATSQPKAGLPAGSSLFWVVDKPAHTRRALVFSEPHNWEWPDAPEPCDQPRTIDASAKLLQKGKHELNQ